MNRNTEGMNNQNLLEICEIISKLNSAEDVKILLNELLTESELSDVIQRWNILKMLIKKESQRNISKVLTVSLCKVTRGSKILKNDKSMIKKILIDERWRK